jgi:hypothetical protein
MTRMTYHLLYAHMNVELTNENAISRILFCIGHGTGGRITGYTERLIAILNETSLNLLELARDCYVSVIRSRRLGIVEVSQNFDVVGLTHLLDVVNSSERKQKVVVLRERERAIIYTTKMSKQVTKGHVRDPSSHVPREQRCRADTEVPG